MERKWRPGWAGAWLPQLDKPPGALDSQMIDNWSSSLNREKEHRKLEMMMISRTLCKVFYRPLLFYYFYFSSP
ncbi:hypothetical protein RRG08_025755 [Elysia crispata]|uniref:Uncharacterized protein n=1 Tax=Elysia crispata TaxID=231223 RepID=A0AAE1AGJ7_9GAST|nr:hypothetical protein RRG08_025755 [Elysia crispata]